MSDPPCDTQLLEVLRRKALMASVAATDPLHRRQYAELAESYAVTATELRDHGAAILPSSDLTLMPWRSVPLWVTNDR